MTWGRDTDEHDAAEQCELFLSAGGNVLDTSDSYGDGVAQEIVGHLIHHLAQDDVIVVSRSGGSAEVGRPFDHSRRHLRNSLDTSLRRLGVDAIDVWCVQGRDFHTPVEEVCEIMRNAVESGKALHVALSDWPVSWLAYATRFFAESPGSILVGCQMEYSLVQRGIESDVLDFVSHFGLGLMAWSPLGRGVLTGKYRRGTPADSRGASAHLRAFVEPYLDLRSRQIVDAVCAAADGLGVAPIDVALAWVRQQNPITSAIVGARTAAQLRGILQGVDLVLPQEIVSVLSEVSAPRFSYPQAGW
jgi:aryl-alcohol dehydrogenase-like predicted oxidoreductase